MSHSICRLCTAVCSMYRVLTSVTTCKQPTKQPTNNLLTCVIGLVSMLWSTGCIDEPKPHKVRKRGAYPMCGVCCMLCVVRCAVCAVHNSFCPTSAASNTNIGLTSPSSSFFPTTYSTKCLFDKVANAQPPVSEDVAKTRYVDQS